MSRRFLGFAAGCALLAGCGSSGALDGGPGAGCSAAAAAADAGPARQTRQIDFTASDGVQIATFLTGAGDYSPRPLIVEFSPYAPTSFSAQFAGPAGFGRDFGPGYNYLEVNARGTGNSGGVWGPVGPRDQQDVAEVLAWACRQPWSNGHIGLYGFSASAIIVYNAMHLPLPCVDAASLMSGTNDLYRDLLYPGGILNLAPAAVVAFGVGVPALGSYPADFFAGRSILDMAQSGLGQIGIYADIVLAHPAEDQYWTDRSMRFGAPANRFPVLADGSFYDAEPRGAFESFRRLRAAGVTARLITYGAHDGFPQGTLGPFPQFKAWFDHYLLGNCNGAESAPAVELLVGNGSHAAFASGDYEVVQGEAWPLPGSRWQPLFLDAARSGSAASPNDGTLSGNAPTASAVQPYLDLLSLPTATDPTAWTVEAAGASSLFDALPLLIQLNAQEPLSLTYSTAPLKSDVVVAGPGSLDLFLATATPLDDLYVVVADVSAQGQSNAVGVGRLRSGYPGIDLSRSIVDASGEVVQPYGDYSALQPATPGQVREYHVEFWPIGNRFAAGDRLRLYLLGMPGFTVPLPGVNLVSLGGATPSRLLLPVLPGSDLAAAIRP